MSNADFQSHGVTRAALLPNSGSAAVDGASLDTVGWRWVKFSLQLGAVAAAGLLKVQQSNDEVTWTDIEDNISTPGTTVKGEIDIRTTDAAGIVAVNVDSSQTARYLRMRVEPGGLTEYGGQAVLYGTADARFYITDADRRSVTVLGHNPIA